MQDKKLKEMFAVVFTFAVMGIIGFSLFKPDSTVMDEGVHQSAKSAVLAQSTSDQVEVVDNGAGSIAKTIVVKSPSN